MLQSTAIKLAFLSLGAGIGYYYWTKARRGSTLGDAKTARLRGGKLACPYCEGTIQCEMPPAICGPEDAAAQFFKQIAKDKYEEAFWVFLLDGRGRTIQSKRLSIGTPESTPANSRAVFRSALLSPRPVASIITVHNHTLDDSTPSQQDLDTTHRLVSAGHLIGIPVIDHLVLGSTGEYTSIREFVEERYGQGAFHRTLILPGGEAKHQPMLEKQDVRGLFGAEVD